MARRHKSQTGTRHNFSIRNRLSLSVLWQVIPLLAPGILTCPRMSGHLVWPSLSLSPPDQKRSTAHPIHPPTPTMFGRTGFVRSPVSELRLVYDSFLA